MHEGDGPTDDCMTCPKFNKCKEIGSGIPWSEEHNIKMAAEPSTDAEFTSRW